VSKPSRICPYLDVSFLLTVSISSGRSVAGSASPAAAVHALDLLVFLELVPRNAANAGRSEVRLLGLDAARAA
jgi:hypothetical protein